MYNNSKSPHPYELKVILIYTKGDVVKLVELNADLGVVPEEKISIRYSPFGVPYYKVAFQVEVTYFSAFTRYELIHDNVNYGPVSAEYV